MNYENFLEFLDMMNIKYLCIKIKNKKEKKNYPNYLKPIVKKFIKKNMDIDGTEKIEFLDNKIKKCIVIKKFDDNIIIIFNRNESIKKFNHDLRNILNSILGLSEITILSEQNNDNIENLNIIVTNVNEITRIMNQLNDMSNEFEEDEI